MFKRLRKAIKRFFVPPSGSPRWAYAIPYIALGLLSLAVLVGGAYGWDYTNSPSFCGTSCHTMPPEYAAYEVSPHARVACVECHIGREFIGNQIFRKAGDLRHVIATTFNTYEFPIRAGKMRPARETCEKCHTPEKFSDDSLRTITHYQDDLRNTPSYTYLVLKTGGGVKREGLGRGIHWHIVNRVLYYSTDALDQNIPYIQVINDDGSTTDYVDVESGFDPSQIAASDLKEMDCITCHNRITHRVYTPQESMDRLLARSTIDASIPEIRRLGVEALSASYTSQTQALESIAGLESYYQTNFPGFYQQNAQKVSAAIQAIQQIYSESVFIEQKVDWDTHPNNLGHIDAPGCFRCHDGKHLDANQGAIRLECNLCHSIPVVASNQDFVAMIEISRGSEPESHRNPNWISLHNQVFNATCTNCHTTDNAGGTSNTSFCSNSACHGTVFTYAGFDAPRLRDILQAQLPPPAPTPTPAPLVETPTFSANIQPIFMARCTVCHAGSNAPLGLDLSTYASVMQGSQNGNVILPGDSAGSKMVQVQTGQHFATFSPEELELVIQWIEASAPE